MKRLVMSLMLGCVMLAPDVLSADDVTKQMMDSPKVQWSFGALSSVIEAMRKNCEYTNGHQFAEIGNWLRARSGMASVGELLEKCVGVAQFQQLKRGAKGKACLLPTDECSSNGTCGELAFVKSYFNDSQNNLGCDIFLSTLIAYQLEDYQLEDLDALDGTKRQPGTYVEQIACSGDGCPKKYVVKDVVLADGYYPSEKRGINQEVNTNPDNTKIWVKDGDKWVDTGLRTWTNDMFLNYETKYDGVRGALVDSVICADVNVTSDILELMGEDRGSFGYSVNYALKSADGGDFDLKRSWADKCPGGGNYGHTNGVVYDGKVVHLEWLGHYLFGRKRIDSNLSGGVIDYGVAALNTVSASDNKLAGVKNAVSGSLVEEVEQFQYAQYLGRQDQKAVSVRYPLNKNFDTPEKALFEAANVMRDEYRDVYNSPDFQCQARCSGAGGAKDYIACFAGVDMVEFVVNDMTNAWDAVCSQELYVYTKAQHQKDWQQIEANSRKIKIIQQMLQDKDQFYNAIGSDTLR